MKEEHKVSFIVPVYNMEKSLQRCVDSILQQSLHSIELILVDDGSSDASGKICDKYKEIDNRVVVVHKENGGVADAMNVGLDAATGDYYLFVDSDDYIDAQMAENMLKVLLQNNLSVIQCGYTIHAVNGDILRKTHENPMIIEGRDKILHNYFLCQGIGGCLSAKLFRAELFRDIRMPKGRMFADVPILPYVFNNCLRYQIINEQFYHVTANPYSVSRGVLTEQKYSDIVYNIGVVEKFIYENYPDLKFHVFYLKSSTVAFYYERIKENPELRKTVGNIKTLKKIFKENYLLLKQSGCEKSYPYTRRLQLRLFNICPYLYIFSERIYRLFKAQ